MANPVGSVRAEMSAGWASFKSDMGKAKKAVQENASGMSKAMDAVKKKFTETAQAVNRFGGYAVAGAAVAMVAFVKQQIDVADKMGKLAQQTGTTSEFLSGMTLVASQAGTSLETVAKGIQRLSMNMDDMKRGVGVSKETFELLNISVDKADGTLRNSEDVMKDIADKFSKMEDGADKTAAAMRIFGRAGAELIPMLNMGSAGIEDLQKKAKEMGLVIGTETALQAAYLNDQLDILIKSAQGTGRSLALNIIPWLNETLAVMKFAKEESGLLMAAWVGLGAVGEAIFGKSLTQQIREAEERVARLSDQLKKAGSHETAGLRILGMDTSEAELAEARAQLNTLQRQKEEIDAADKSRMEASLKRYQDEADQRRKNTEELIKQQQAKIDAQIKAKEAEIAANAEAKKAAEEKKQLEQEAQALYELRRELYLQDEAAKFAELEEYEKEYAEKQAKFQEAHKRATLTSKDYELQQLRSLYDEYATYIDDKTKLDEWYAAEKARILGKSVEKEKSDISELKTAIEGWGRDSADAIVKFARTGESSFKDMIDSMINDLLRMMVYQNITKPLFGSIGGFFGSAKGNIFQGGNVLPFARGGIVSQPTIFPMARGAGLMGEAGAEAILPLARTSGGDLGVKTSETESQQMNVNVAITAVDAASFQDLMRRNPGAVINPIVTALTSQGHRPLINAVKGIV
ncbi:MAG: phage tail tape measure C-terminal domain-containing protein [Dehalococcoidales bacterium]